MDKLRILEEIKKDIVASVSTLRIETLSREVRKLSSYISILQAINDLPEESNSKDESASLDTSGTEEVKDDINHLYTGRFHRELTGGSVGSFRVFVPESVVRNLRLQDGDWVRAKGLKSIVLRNGNIRTLYDYTLLRRTTEILPSERKELNLIRVHYDDELSHHYIDVQDEIENYDRLVLNERDIKQLEIGQGDWVDYAYYESEPSAGRVIWKHKLPYQLLEMTEPQEPPSLAEGAAFFRDKGIVVIGTLNDALPIQEAIEEYGGQLSFLGGDERFDTMERVAQAGDELVVVVDSIAPSGMKKVQDIAERLRLPILYVRDMDKNRFLVTLMHNEPNLLLIDKDNSEEE